MASLVTALWAQLFSCCVTHFIVHLFSSCINNLGLRILWGAVRSLLKSRQTMSSTLCLFAELNVLPQKTDCDLLIPNICRMDVASGKKICFHNSPCDPGKNFWSDSVALCMSHLLKSFLTWSSTHESNASFPWNPAVGSDLISIKSAKDSTECLSLFCVLCLYVPC